MTYSNTLSGVGTTVAAMVLERALSNTGAGLAVQPVVWVTTGTMPDAVDGALYGIGAVAALAGSAFVGIPVTIVGGIRSMANDYNETNVEEARQQEPALSRRGVKSLGASDWTGRSGVIQAATIARAGGVAWKHENGAWLFISDANGHLVCDYEPVSWVEIYRPLLPLRTPHGGSGVVWAPR